jgi:hypothetical protein
MSQSIIAITNTMLWFARHHQSSADSAEMRDSAPCLGGGDPQKILKGVGIGTGLADGACAAGVRHSADPYRCTEGYRLRLPEHRAAGGGIVYVE